MQSGLGRGRGRAKAPEGGTSQAVGLSAGSSGAPAFQQAVSIVEHVFVACSTT